MAPQNGESLREEPVTVSFRDLVDGVVPLSKLEDAFGPSSLGIIIVKDLPPQYPTLRHRLLSYSSYLGNLPPGQLENLESQTAKYLTGWSLGKEKLKTDKPDTLKGSYYVNCAFYQDSVLQGAPVNSPKLKNGSTKNYVDFPEHTAPNVWPGEDALPGFESTCVELCSLIIDVAILVARACDRFAEENVENYDAGYLEKMVKTSMTTKARLLHYFPPGAADNDTLNGDGADQDDDDWCATHIDHGCLTGLTSAMYVDETAHPPTIAGDAVQGQSGTSSTFAPPLPELTSPPDPQTGLYIHSRTSTVTKVSIPRDCLAFQTGEALEMITKGRFKAVPHFVRGASSKGGSSDARVARNTLAVFTQPNLWELVDRERGVDFAAFSREVHSRHY